LNCRQALNDWNNLNDWNLWNESSVEQTEIPAASFPDPPSKLRTSPALVPALPESDRTLTSAYGLGRWQLDPPGSPDLQLS
jgi:hypothetical protein